MDNARTIKTSKDVWTLVFLEDGRHILSGGREEVIRQWHIEDGKEIEDQRLSPNGHLQVSAIALSGDGNWIVSGGWRTVTIWNRKTREIAHSAREHSNWVNEIHVSPDSTKFATASDDYRVIIWNTSNGRPFIQPLQHGNSVLSVRFSPDGNRVATAVRNGELRIYNAHNGQLLRDIAVTCFSTNPISWSGDSQNIFVLSSRNVLKHIHVDTPSFVSEWTVPGRPNADNYGSIALSRNSRFIAVFVGDTLTFWDASTRAQLGAIFDHAQAPQPYTIALSPNSNYVATGGYGGTITIRNLTDIIPMSHRIDQSIENGANTRLQIEVLRSLLRDLESRSGSACPGIPICVPLNANSSDGLESLPIDDNPQAQITPLHISNGTYRIKSNTGDLYLTCPRDGTATAVVQTLDQFNISQTWAVSPVADGAYDIMGNLDLSLTVGIGSRLLLGQKGTTWTFEPRGDAYVIGNAANAMAIQLEPNSRSVSVLIRNNSVYQRWVLEPVPS